MSHKIQKTPHHKGSPNRWRGKGATIDWTPASIPRAATFRSHSACNAFLRVWSSGHLHGTPVSPEAYWDIRIKAHPRLTDSASPGTGLGTCILLIKLPRDSHRGTTTVRRVFVVPGCRWEMWGPWRLNISSSLCRVRWWVPSPCLWSQSPGLTDRLIHSVSICEAPAKGQALFWITLTHKDQV